MKPQRLGNVSIPDEELIKDKKECKKIGPCGIGKKAVYLSSFYIDRRYYIHWITAVPATFMSAVSMTYFFCAEECLGLSTKVAYPVGIILAAAFLGIFIHATKKPMKA